MSIVNPAGETTRSTHPSVKVKLPVGSYELDFRRRHTQCFHKVKYGCARVNATQSPDHQVVNRCYCESQFATIATFQTVDALSVQVALREAQLASDVVDAQHA